MRNVFASLTVLVAGLGLIAIAPADQMARAAENSQMTQAQAPAQPPMVDEKAAAGVAAMEKFRAAEQLAWEKWLLQHQRDAIYKANSPTLGASQPKVSIIEFYDYNCGYCRKIQPLLQEFLSKNPDTQLVLKDAAFLNKDSQAVGKIVLAAQKQKDITELHNTLMNRQGPNTEAAALELAGTLGFDIARLKEDAASSGVSDSIQNTRNLTIELRMKGTPLFIVGHTLISGAGAELQNKLTNAVEQVRRDGCDVC